MRGSSSSVPISADLEVCTYPEPLACSVCDEKNVLPELDTTPWSDQRAFEDLLRAAEKMRPDDVLTADEFKEAVGEGAAEIRPVKTLLSLATVFDKVVSLGASIRLAVVEPSYSEGGEAPFDGPPAATSSTSRPSGGRAILAALAIGPEAAPVQAVRNHWFERAIAERALASRTGAIMREGRREKLARLFSHYVDRPLWHAVAELQSLVDRLAQESRRDQIRKELVKNVVGLWAIASMTKAVRLHAAQKDEKGRRVTSEYSGSTDLTEILSVLRPDVSGSILGHLVVGSRVDIRPEIVDRDFRVRGTLGEWAIILYTLLKNALEAAAESGRAVRMEQSYVSVDLSANASTPPLKKVEYATITVTNTTAPLSDETLKKMRGCLRGDVPSMDPNGSKSDSMGLGLATVGQFLKKLEAGATVKHSRDQGTIIITITVRMAD